MPSENKNASSCTEARSSSTVTGGRTKAPVPAQDGSAASPAAAVVSAEGDELLKRIQSALEEDDSVDLLLPSLTALQVIPNTGGSGAVQQKAGAAQARDSNGSFSNMLQTGGSQSSTSSRSSREATVALDDHSTRSRNLGLGLAALHKMQQRMVQEQQQQKQDTTTGIVQPNDYLEGCWPHSPNAPITATGVASSGGPLGNAVSSGSIEAEVSAPVNVDAEGAAASAKTAKAAISGQTQTGDHASCVLEATIVRPNGSAYAERQTMMALHVSECQRLSSTTTATAETGAAQSVAAEGLDALPVATESAEAGILAGSLGSLDVAAIPVCVPRCTADEALAQGAGRAVDPEEAAMRAEAAAMSDLVGSLKQQLQQVLQQQQEPEGRHSAIDALGKMEQRLRLALEAVDYDVAVLHREAEATAAAAVPPVGSSTAARSSHQSDDFSSQPQLNRDTEASQGDDGEMEDEEGFKSMESMEDSSAAAAAAAVAAAAAAATAGGAAAAGLWSNPCRALLRAALQSAGRHLPKGRRRGARGGPREWGEAARYRPPLDVLCLAASQTKAECSLTPDEATAAAAAAAVAATAAVASGSDAAAAAAAAEVLLPLSAAAAAGDGVRNIPWLPAEGPMVDSLAASNHSQAFTAGLPLLREICRIATVELRVPTYPAVAAAISAAATGSSSTAAAAAATTAAASAIGIAGLRRLGLPGDQQQLRRGPLWVEPPPPDEEDEGPRGPPPTLVSPSCNEQLMLFLRRELFSPDLLQQLEQQPLGCRAELLLPSGYEEGAHDGGSSPAAAAAFQRPEDHFQPVLRLRRLRTTPSRGAEGAAGNEAATDAAHHLEENTGRHCQGPLVVDDALVLINKQQQKQQQALEQLLQQLRELSHGISMQQLVLLAAIVDSMNPAEAAAAAAAVGDSDAVVFSDQNRKSDAPEAAAEGTACEKDQQQQLQKLHEWLSLFPQLGVSAGRAVALMAAAGEQQHQHQQTEGEPIDIRLTFSSLMPFPDEDPGVVVSFFLPQKRVPQQPWKWDLRILEGPFRKNQPGHPYRGPLSIQNVRRRISERQQRLSFLLSQQKVVCKAFYKAWRCHRRQLERHRLAAGDLFGWGVLPVRAVDHPSLLMALPAGFRQGNPKEPYEKQHSRDTAEEVGLHDRNGARRPADATGRRTLRGEACNDRQRAKEEAASRESKREWMQANFSNLTGPGVFWRDSCLFSQGQSLRQRFQRQQESSGVHPVELLQTDPDWAIFDWERECGYTCNSTRVFEPVEQEAERKAVTVWAESEARTFVEKFLMYPKNFEKIAACLDGKTTRDCVDFYYRFKFKFGLKRRLQELEDGTRVKKKNRHIGSKQIRREELVAEAVAGLSSDCGTSMMRRFNGRNFLPFDVFSDHLLHRDALQTTLKDPLSCRGEEWADGDSDGPEIFVENMSDGYFLPATTKGFVGPGRVVSLPADAGLWGPGHRCYVPSCFLIDQPQQTQPEGADTDASPPAAGPPPSLKFSQLDTLLTCIQAASRKHSQQDDEGPSYMTRSRAARSRPGAPVATAGGQAPQQMGSSSVRLVGAGGGHSGAGAPMGPGQLSPRARAIDLLLQRLKGIVRAMQHNARLASRERRRSQADEPANAVGDPGMPSSPITPLKLTSDEGLPPTPD
ncbi:uncharacterized protein LOC34621807 [Cyclospora cayetanensis]|uniref:Uncharacterized protein LOC34621807 n=1 Tax=Cyclospora cayetanensis TaxID=88456 RepID=A0A6P6RVS4_9EIME|nr:uncharacterized protein LOC34621807 [Cyclospora cayetanensis]